MFYISETDSQLQFLENAGKGGVFVLAIPDSFAKHPKLAKAIAVYVRPLSQSKGYIIPIEHDDGMNVDKARVSAMLLNYDKVYTLDKKNLLYHFNIQRAIDINLLYSMTYFQRLDVSYDTLLSNWYSRHFSSYLETNRIIPLTKLHEHSELLFEKIKQYIELEVPSGFEFYNNLATNVFFLLEQKGLGIVYNSFEELFKPRNINLNTKDNVTYTSYNLYNSTSRPTNSYNSVNYAAIPKSESHRQAFLPQNDYFVEFDFDGYHLRLLCDQINYPLTDESAHKQLAKHYFGTTDITEEQYDEAKQINFQALYGKIPRKHKNLEIFKLIQEFIDNMYDVWTQTGIVCNPESGKPFTKELGRMNPAKLMNYMMQSLETSRNVLILKEVLRYLRDKKTAPVLYTYDAILFDYSKEDGKELLENLEKILSEDGKYPVKFKSSKNLVL